MDEKRIIVSAPHPETLQFAPPPPPAPDTQSKGSSSASASGTNSAGKGYSEIPAKARPVAAPEPISTEPPPQPLLIMKPQRSAVFKNDPHTLSVMLNRSVCLEAFKLRVKHKVAKSVWTLAENPSDLAIACLVEGRLQKTQRLSAGWQPLQNNTFSVLITHALLDTLLITKRNHVRYVTHKPHRQLTHRCLHFSMKVRRMDEGTDVRIDACAIRLVENTLL